MYNPLFTHGDDSYRFRVPIDADFSSNVGMDSPSDGLLAHLGDRLSVIGNYPQLHAESLTEGYASFHDVDSQMILVVNGTAEAIFLIACHFQRVHSTIVSPTFSEYENACLLHQHSIDYVAVDSISSLTRTAAGLFWLCNPNNPTGHCFDLLMLDRLIGDNPQTIFVIDEAYINLCLLNGSMVDAVARHENLIVLRSLTKQHAIPGLRLGYVVGQDRLIQALSAHQPPWSVNALAIEAGLFFLNNPSVIDVPGLLSRARRLQQMLEESTGWGTLPSSTAYFLMEAPVPAPFLKQLLVDRYGILIRDASNFRGLSNCHFRVCSQNDEKNKLLEMALRELKSLRI